MSTYFSQRKSSNQYGYHEDLRSMQIIINSREQVERVKDYKLIKCINKEKLFQMKILKLCEVGDIRTKQSNCPSQYRNTW